MSKLTLKDIAEKMKDIDVCMMTTHMGEVLESRPMSNNREVEYNGDSYFFTLEKNAVAKEIEKNPQVNLSFIHEPALLGKAFYLSVTGKAKLISDKAQMKKHWVKDVEAWFKDGIDTPGLVMIQVKAKRMKYWYNYEEGELTL